MKRAFFLLMVLLAVPCSAYATTVRLLNEQQMTAKAAQIVRGTVVSVTPRQHPAGWIVTDVTVKVDKALKGDKAAKTVTFTQLGGTLGDKTLHVSGTSVYTPGEKVLLFLERGGESLVELGVGAGKYGVFDDHGKLYVERRLGKLNFAEVQGRKASVAAPPVVRGPELLDVFEARIASYLAE